MDMADELKWQPNEILQRAKDFVEGQHEESLRRMHVLIRRQFISAVIHSDADMLESIYRATVNFCDWFDLIEAPKWPDMAPLVGRWEEIGELSRQLSEVWQQRNRVDDLNEYERRILSTLVSEEPVTSGYLAGQCNMNNQQQIAPYLRRLEVWGFIRRRKSGRNVLVWLGTEGQRVAESRIPAEKSQWTPQKNSKTVEELKGKRPVDEATTDAQNDWHRVPLQRV